MTIGKTSLLSQQKGSELLTQRPALLNNAKLRWIVLALVALAACGLCLIGSWQSGRHFLQVQGTRPAGAACPHERTQPWKIPGLDHIVSIAYQGGWLAAIDSEGRTWSYRAQPTEYCIGTPQHVYLGRHAGDDDPSATRMYKLASSTSEAIGLSDDGRVVRWYHDRVNDACPHGSHHPGPCQDRITDVRRDMTDVSRSHEHLLAVDREGAVWSEGMNDCGQLGSFDRQGQFSSESRGYGRVPGLPKITAVATGSRYSAALDEEGRVWGWGSLSTSWALAGGIYHAEPMAPLCRPAGRSAMGLDETPHVLPVQVTGLPSVRSIDMFQNFVLAIDRDGHPWAWGYDECGVTGRDPKALAAQATFQRQPQRIEGMPSLLAVSAGVRHALFLDKNGVVWATGNDGAGQLGAMVPRHTDPRQCASSEELGADENYSEVPVKVPSLPPIVGIAAGRDRSAALDRDGHVWIWGRNR
ncbi:hypothetical protein [Luteibacter sp. 22Crub2.1]|uniref:RCC1 domain-containing protein n=1 Tax=Luteibacter sp. 22Crub2.1 TaxID=1283288 RepID=UPI0011169DC8|nr:hypothetical protein [Luteibacter sp. 22Crub2.1]